MQNIYSKSKVDPTLQQLQSVIFLHGRIRDVYEGVHVPGQTRPITTVPAGTLPRDINRTFNTKKDILQSTSYFALHILFHVEALLAQMIHYLSPQII